MIEHQVFDLLRRPVKVEFVVTRIHNDCNEEARFDVIRRLCSPGMPLTTRFRDSNY